MVCPLPGIQRHHEDVRLYDRFRFQLEIGWRGERTPDSRFLHKRVKHDHPRDGELMGYVWRGRHDKLTVNELVPRPSPRLLLKIANRRGGPALA